MKVTNLPYLPAELQAIQGNRKIILYLTFSGASQKQNKYNIVVSYV